MRRLLLAVGGLAIVVAAFSITLSALNYFDTPRTPEQARDAIRARDAGLLKAALQKYHDANQKYPMFPDNDANDLQRDLVGGGYLAEIPKDPSSAKGLRYRYAANATGTAFGLMFLLEAPAGNVPAGGLCVSRAKGSSASFWGNLPDCPF